MFVVRKQHGKYTLFISFSCNIIVKYIKSSYYNDMVFACSVPQGEWNRVTQISGPMVIRADGIVRSASVQDESGQSQFAPLKLRSLA